MQQILTLGAALRPFNRLLVAALILTGLTWLAGDVNFRALPVAGSMNLPAFPGERSAWSLIGPVNNVTFTERTIELGWNSPTQTIVVRSLPITPRAGDDGPLVRISGHLEQLNDASAQRSLDWQARFLVLYRQGDEVLQYGAVTDGNGHYARRRFEYLVQPPAGSESIELRWQIRAAGRWQLSRLDVSAVAINRHYQVAAAGLVVCWLLYLGYLAIVILRTASGTLTAGLLVSVCVIVAGTGMGQPMMNALVHPVLDVFWSVYPGEHLPGVQTLLKTGHVLAFMLLTGLLLRLRHTLALPVAGIVALSVTLAAASESLQRHRFNRSPELRDVLIDCIGIALALGCFACWAWYRGRRERVDVHADVNADVDVKVAPVAGNASGN